MVKNGGSRRAVGGQEHGVTDTGSEDYKVRSSSIDGDGNALGGSRPKVVPDESEGHIIARIGGRIGDGVLDELDIPDGLTRPGE